MAGWWRDFGSAAKLESLEHVHPNWSCGFWGNRSLPAVLCVQRISLGPHQKDVHPRICPRPTAPVSTSASSKSISTPICDSLSSSRVAFSTCAPLSVVYEYTCHGLMSYLARHSRMTVFKNDDMWRKYPSSRIISARTCLYRWAASRSAVADSPWMALFWRRFKYYLW